MSTNVSRHFKKVLFYDKFATRNLFYPSWKPETDFYYPSSLFSAPFTTTTTSYYPLPVLEHLVRAHSSEKPPSLLRSCWNLRLPGIATLEMHAESGGTPIRQKNWLILTTHSVKQKILNTKYPESFSTGTYPDDLKKSPFMPAMILPDDQPPDQPQDQTYGLNPGIRPSVSSKLISLPQRPQGFALFVTLSTQTIPLLLSKKKFFKIYQNCFPFSTNFHDGRANWKTYK